VTGSRTLYYPYGEQRWSASGGTLPTDYTFTGQRNEAGIGLMDYNARFYDPALGRFVSADTIVPEPANPQSLNRYSYVLNSPLNYRDPSGHAYDAGDAWAGRRDTPPPPPDEEHEDEIESGFTGYSIIPRGVRLEGSNWVPIVPLLLSVGFDGNVDAYYDIVKQDGRWTLVGDILVTGGVQVGIGVGYGSINAGPTWTNANIDEYSEIQYHIGGTLSDDVLLGLVSSETGGPAALLGLEGDYGWAGGKYSEGERPTSFFLGVIGLGEEFEGWAGTHVVDFHPLTGEGSIKLFNATLMEGNLYDRLTGKQGIRH
jgi:RHS repeat-associated protein